MRTARIGPGARCLPWKPNPLFPACNEAPRDPVEATPPQLLAGVAEACHPQCSEEVAAGIPHLEAATDLEEEVRTRPLLGPMGEEPASSKEVPTVAVLEVRLLLACVGVTWVRRLATWEEEVVLENRKCRRAILRNRATKTTLIPTCAMSLKQLMQTPRTTTDRRLVGMRLLYNPTVMELLHRRMLRHHTRIILHS